MTDLILIELRQIVFNLKYKKCKLQRGIGILDYQNKNNIYLM